MLNEGALQLYLPLAGAAGLGLAVIQKVLKNYPDPKLQSIIWLNCL
jgi:hypothetical protein